MGQLVYSMIASLDGYVADEDGEFASWAQPDEQVLAAINETFSRVSTCLMGRRMYELMSVWETDDEVIHQSPKSTEFARLWQRADKIVYSRTLTSVPTSRTQLRAQFNPEEVARIKKEAAGDVTIDGPTVAAEGFRAGLVDRLDVLFCPVVLGGGLRLLPEQRIELSLIDKVSFDNGMIQLSYEVGTHTG
ncbi:dihydrofolate reductase family protein [Citricoccus muralis]|uniref:Dihydrofolate reductase family protein n=1 Tax=Citricoccus muralis TaxID=169134 RepID=A0ABY8H3N4_9MICC|nr:dihydrofolate reductase family protein [Citricoccus muralis]WFP15743.1 dihydrofolate reductase family protein [Citricoccus muralis]